jgi:hypothetical protein
MSAAAEEAVDQEAGRRPRPYRCALIKSMEYGSVCVHGQNWRDDDEVSLPGYVRVSDIVEIEFPPLSDDAVVAGAIRALDETRAELSREFARKLADIDRQKAELLAITHQVPA